MICCVTGHRPSGFPFERIDGEPLFLEYKHRLDIEIDTLINEGCRYFITGLTYGADLDFADAVISYRRHIPDVRLEAALPYPYSLPKEPTGEAEEKEAILRECDVKHVVCTHYHRGCMQKRNRYMVDKADIVLTIWNGKERGGTWDTVKYARSKNKPIRYIMLNEMGKWLLTPDGLFEEEMSLRQ